MIGSLRGVLVDRADREFTLEVGGVGYRCLTTQPAAAALGPVGADVFVWIHHHIREDAQVLYAFPTRDDRDLFEQLIGTHGVGPGLGLAIMSTFSAHDLRVAVVTEDLAALCEIPGVGRKTATRLLVELRSRLELSEVDLTSPSAPTVSVSGGTSSHDDVRVALAGLGYTEGEIGPVLRGLPEDGDVSELLRTALRELAAS